MVVQKKRIKKARRVTPTFDLDSPVSISRPKSPSARARMNGEPCPLCNEEHVDRFGNPGCNGHIKRSDPKRPCTNAAINGLQVCGAHGGNLPQVAAAGARRVAYADVEGQVAKLMREMDMPDQHPLDGLLEVVRHAGSMMRLLASLVAALDLKPNTRLATVGDGAELGGDVGVVRWNDNDALTGYTHLGDGAPHVLVVLYGQWQDRYARACKLALDANIDERLVRNAEATTGAVYKAIEKALGAAELDPAQTARFGKALAEQLRLIADPMNAKERTA